MTATKPTDTPQLTIETPKDADTVTTSETRRRPKKPKSGRTAFGRPADAAAPEQEAAETPTADAQAPAGAGSGDETSAELEQPETAATEPAPVSSDPATPTSEGAAPADASPAPAQAPAAADDAGGITGALRGGGTTPQPTDGGWVMLDPQTVAPHPYNAPDRSRPQPENPKYVELRDSIRAKGVQIAARVVTIEAFLAARPNLADELKKLNPKAEYVAIYGHRRRAAAEETGRPLKAEIDDAVMKDNGDLAMLAVENYGREDFSELDEARMFQNYMGSGISQRGLAKLLGGVTQATISRRLALLNTIPEIQKAIEGRNEDFKKDDGTFLKLAPVDAAVIAGKLPYCDPSVKKEGSLSPERRADQLDALERVLVRKWTATRAADYVATARASVEKAAAEKVDIVEPREFFKGESYKHVIRTDEDREQARKDGELVAQVDDSTGELNYYTKALPQKTKAEPSSQQQKEQEEDKQRKSARAKRMEFLPKVIKTPLPLREMTFFLARHFHDGIAQAAGASEAGKLAGKLWHEAGLLPSFAEEWRELMAANLDDPKLDVHGAWVRVIAALENNAYAAYRTWNHVDIAYFDILRDKGGYKPTEWESARLETAKAAHAAAVAADEDPAADDNPAADDAAAEAEMAKEGASDDAATAETE
ncbi:hypothetical protein [Amycolatopsis sp. 505]|uniref:ParB/RepB/Spo0J family partition protein n=1 Tax=Amycolatopsis sp. 505 TaxID=2761538 RepID=UPI002876149D|nr:hypothetical protein [Amycolatopsis sp. 505]MDS0140621.1 hypothetical protein [Amycolatopsis sp. 505]